jgi:hypothetical protein
MSLIADLDCIRQIVQVDVGNRGLARDPIDNLFTACAKDFVDACFQLARSGQRIGIVTGFYIADADPPAFETDGPPGALALAAALRTLNRRVCLFTPPELHKAIVVGMEECGIPTNANVRNISITSTRSISETSALDDLTHLVFIECVGPSADGRCYSMRGRDVTDTPTPGLWLWKQLSKEKSIVTIGIGDGGNEIGMGKIGPNVIKRNIPFGHIIHCQLATDYLVVSGVSNWGAVGLAVGVARAAGFRLSAQWFDEKIHFAMLKRMVEEGRLVDGVTGRFEPTVDGISWDQHKQVFRKLSLLGDRQVDPNSHGNGD